MEFNLFKFGFNRLDCYKDISNQSFSDSDSQEDYNLIAKSFRSLIDSHFELSIETDNEFMEIYIHFIGDRFIPERSYRTYIERHNIYADINQVLTVLTAFASGLGYDC